MSAPRIFRSLKCEIAGAEPERPFNLRPKLFGRKLSEGNLACLGKNDELLEVKVVKRLGSRISTYIVGQVCK